MSSKASSFRPKTAPLMLILTDYRGNIPQRIMAWDSWDLAIIRRSVEAGGIETLIAGAHEFDFGSLAGRHPVAVLYASSQEPRYKQYLLGILVELQRRGCILVPDLLHFIAHDDKACQAHRLNGSPLNAPTTRVFGYRDHANEFLKTARFPLVGKPASGFGSAGVTLIRNEQEGRAFVQQQMEHRVYQKGRPLWRRASERLVKPPRALGLVVFQEYVRGLSGDWKILIWGRKACGAFRRNRPNDFRASGSGLLSYDEVPQPVLEFASSALAELDLPWASFDIGFDGQDCHLLEYQGVHFGLTILDRSKYYYERAEGGWRRVDGKLPMEEEVGSLLLAEFEKHKSAPAVTREAER